jgi:hypothetical protein
MRRLRCFLAGGHRWQTATDGAGPLTACSRCGTLLRRRTRAADDASFLMHTDVAADFARRDTHGAEETDVRPGSRPPD